MDKEHENDVMRKALEKIRFEIESYFLDDEGALDSHEKLVDSFLENPIDYVSLRNTFFEIDRILRDCDGIISSAKTHEENRSIS